MTEKYRVSSPLTTNAVAYTWRQLAQRVGLSGGDPRGTGFEGLDLPIFYIHPDQVNCERPSIIVSPCHPNTWKELLNRSSNSLSWLPTDQVLPSGVQLPFNKFIPILFWGDGFENQGRPLAEYREDGSVVFYVDIIATIFFMLSRWEETVITTRDEYERFPATASLAYQQGFLDQPIVDQYALIFKAWLHLIAPNLLLKPHQFSIKLTHDIDSIFRFPSIYRWLHTLGGDLLKRRSLPCLWRSCLDTLALFTAPQQISHFQGIRLLASLSIRYGLESAFYFMAGKPGADPIENDYDVTSPLLKTCIDDLRLQGFEIGLHPSYYTFSNLDQLTAEKLRLDAILGETSYGGRQHYLRFQAPETWRNWANVGLSYDSSLCYADYEGFRCGTCHPFHPFDIDEDCEINLWEYPLIVMDSTIQRCRGLTPNQGRARMLELARHCQEVNGTFVLLWHNASFYGVWRPWAKVYEEVLKTLAEMLRSNEAYRESVL